MYLRPLSIGQFTGKRWVGPSAPAECARCASLAATVDLHWRIHVPGTGRDSHKRKQSLSTTAGSLASLATPFLSRSSPSAQRASTAVEPIGGSIRARGDVQSRSGSWRQTALRRTRRFSSPRSLCEIRLTSWRARQRASTPYCSHRSTEAAAPGDALSPERSSPVAADAAIGMAASMRYAQPQRQHPDAPATLFRVLVRLEIAVVNKAQTARRVQFAAVIRQDE
jgi:hypothetical protein